MGAQTDRHLWGYKITMKRLLIALPFITMVLVPGCSSSSTENPFDDSSSRATDTFIVLPTNEATQEADSPLTITKITPTFPIAPDNKELDEQIKEDESETQDPAGPTPAPKPTVTTEEESTFLETALAIVPTDASEFLFTNWNKIKRHYRVSSLTSEFPMEDKEWLLKKVVEDNQAGKILDEYYLEFQANL